MTLGFPTILIPAIKGGDGRDPRHEGDFLLSDGEISWLSKLTTVTLQMKDAINLLIYGVLFYEKVPSICYLCPLAVYFLVYSPKLWVNAEQCK